MADDEDAVLLRSVGRHARVCLCLFLALAAVKRECVVAESRIGERFRRLMFVIAVEVRVRGFVGRWVDGEVVGGWFGSDAALRAR